MSLNPKTGVPPLLGTSNRGGMPDGYHKNTKIHIAFQIEILIEHTSPLRVNEYKSACDKLCMETV